MNFVNDYILYKLLFEDKPVKRFGASGSRGPSRPPSVTVAPPSRRSSIFGTENRRISTSDWRGSCIDVSHLSSSSHHLPIKQRLQRKRSGSWSAGTNSTLSSASMMTIAEGDECASRKTSICPSPTMLSGKIRDHVPRKISSESTKLLEPIARPSIPKLVVNTTVRKKLSFPAEMEVPKEKEKLTRKRSSCPNAVELIAQGTKSAEQEVPSEVRTNHKLSVEISPPGQAEHSLLTAYLRICQAAARDDDTSESEEERDHVVLHLGYNYPSELLWNRGCRSPPPSSYKRQQVHKDPPVGDLISFESSDESPKEENEHDDIFDKTARQSKDTHRDSDPVSVHRFHKNIVRKHLEAEHCHSDPVILKSLKMSSTSKRFSYSNETKDSNRHYKSRHSNSPIHRPKTSSGSWRPPSRSSDTRRSQKRSPSAPSPRGGSLRRHKIQTPLDSPDLSKMALGSRMSHTLEVNEPLEPNPVQDQEDAGTKDKQPLMRTRSTLLRRMKASAEVVIPEILLTLSYSTSIGFITVTVNKARNLKPALNSYVKVMLFESHRLLELKQTSFVTDDCNPEYKQAYMFGLGKSSVANINIVVEVWINGVNSEQRNLGHVVLGVGAGGTGTIQFIRMVKNAGFPAVMWHKLITGDAEDEDI